jgi:hypothetical protein
VPRLQAIPLLADSTPPVVPAKRIVSPVITVDGSTILVRNVGDETVRVYNSRGTLVAMKRCHGSCRIDLHMSRDERASSTYDYIIQVGDNLDNLWRLRWRRNERSDFIF